MVTIENLIDELNLKVFKVEKLQTHGGSIRLWITKSNYLPIDESVHLERTYELNSQIFDKSILELFSKKALNRVNKFNNFIESLNQKILRFMLISAAAKGISFLNFCGDHARSIQGVFDKNEMKQGCYIPGLNIEILDPKKIKKIPT